MTFRRVTLPGMRTALLAGGLLAFALSFDEIIVTNFTAGAGTQTIPMWILSAIQRPAELPVVNVVALVLIVLSVIPVWLATRISRRSDGGRPGLTAGRYQRRAWSRITAMAASIGSAARAWSIDRARARRVVMGRLLARPPGRRSIRWLDPVRGVPDRRCGTRSIAGGAYPRLIRASPGGSIRP